MEKIIIGSRGSDLALWQANYTKDQLENLGFEVEIKIIITQGDAIQNLSFDKLEGKGFFTKEIENELLAGTIDLAVHSHKDLETNPPAGLIIGAVSNRENPADLLLIQKSKVDASQKWNLVKGGIVGTSSARRKSLVKAHREDAEIIDLRGNVPTRIQKLRDGNYDSILLAKAGVDRLEIDLSEFHVEVLDPKEFVPAPAQGVLGLQIRENDQRMKDVTSKLNNVVVAKQIAVERRVLNLMEGGCQLPLGVFCESEKSIYVSFAKNWNEGADIHHFELESSEESAVKIVNSIK